jgi:hypothetical protein
LSAQTHLRGTLPQFGTVVWYINRYYASQSLWNTSYAEEAAKKRKKKRKKEKE